MLLQMLWLQPTRKNSQKKLQPTLMTKSQGFRSWTLSGMEFMKVHSCQLAHVFPAMSHRFWSRTEFWRMSLGEQNDSAFAMCMCMPIKVSLRRAAFQHAKK